MCNLENFNPFEIEDEDEVEQKQGLVKYTGLIENSAMAFDEIAKTKRRLKFCMQGYLKMFYQKKIKVLINKF